MSRHKKEHSHVATSCHRIAKSAGDDRKTLRVVACPVRVPSRQVPKKLPISSSVPLRLRDGAGHPGRKPATEVEPKLRVCSSPAHISREEGSLPVNRTSDARTYQLSGDEGVSPSSEPVLPPEGQGIQGLRRTRDYCLRQMAWPGRVCALLRRHGAALKPEARDRPHRQQRSLLAGQLSLGYSSGTSPQQEDELRHRLGRPAPHCGGMGGNHRHRRRDDLSPSSAPRLAGRGSVDHSGLAAIPASKKGGV